MVNKPRSFFLAIRHIPTGGFLPAVKGYGFTRTSPTLEDPPRLFSKRGPCNQALTRWLEGELFEGVDDDEGVLSLRLVRRPERSRAAMEIVEIELVVRSMSDAQLRVL